MMSVKAGPRPGLPFPSKKRRGVAAVFTVLAFVFTVVLLASCGGSGGEPAPDFQVTRFDGTEFRLSDNIGKSAVVVNFWYPSCPPCRAEMPAFEQAWQQLRNDDVQFLGIFVPQGFDSEQDARDFASSLGLTYGLATDKGARIAQSFELEAFPTTYFIDKSGRISRTHLSILDRDMILRFVGQMTKS